VERRRVPGMGLKGLILDIVKAEVPPSLHVQSQPPQPTCTAQLKKYWSRRVIGVLLSQDCRLFNYLPLLFSASALAGQ